MEKQHYLQEDLTSFLNQSIERAIERHKLELTPPAQQYLVEMLERFAEHFSLHKDLWLTPVTFQYQRINDELNRAQRMQLQRDLGDHCLFLVGYFYDFIRKQGEGQIKYHAQIGSAAYRQTGRTPFVEVGQKFGDLYLVIGDLHLPQLDERRTIEIYERWEETRDRYYASLLTGKGIIPQPLKKNSN